MKRPSSQRRPDTSKACRGERSGRVLGLPIATFWLVRQARRAPPAGALCVVLRIICGIGESFFTDGFAATPRADLASRPLNYRDAPVAASKGTKVSNQRGSDPHTIGVVVVAAGMGVRLGANGPKALVEVAGRSLLAHTLDGLASAGLPPAVVVYSPGELDAFKAAVGNLEVAAYVPGGKTRTDSVRAGVGALAPEVEVVAVHDAARPLMPPQVMRATVDVVCEAPTNGAAAVVGAAPAIPVADTLKRVADDDVVATVDRTALVGVQTPQVFRRQVLLDALESPESATDDLGLVEQAITEGHLQGRVVVVPGSAWGRKFTYVSDLTFMGALAAITPDDVVEAGQ